jgi:hypothetical protein
MHPLIARFLDVEKVIEVLRQSPDDDDARALVSAIEHDGGLKQQLLAHSRKTVPHETQQRLLVASLKAATERVLADAELGKEANKALEEAVAAGASREDARGVIQQAIFEEGFGWPEAPDVFDVPFLRETLATVPALAKLDADAVESLVDRFVKAGEPTARAMRLAVADSVLEVAWNEGAQPIAAEHIDDAMDLLAKSVASRELPLAAQTVATFLGFLESHQLVGPLRRERLIDVAKNAALAPETDEEIPDDEEAEDDDEP